MKSKIRKIFLNESGSYLGKSEGCLLVRDRKGKRQYLNGAKNGEFLKRLNSYFKNKVEIPRIKVGKKQEIETLIAEEAFLFAKYLRGEKTHWEPRIAELR